MSTSGNARTEYKKRATSIGSEGSSSSKKFKPDSEKTLLSDPSGATASETPAAATVMSYDDSTELGSILKAEDLKQRNDENYVLVVEGIYFGDVRKWRDTKNRKWKSLVSLFTEPAIERLTKALEQTSTLVLGRMAEQNFGFDERMTHKLDVQALETRLREIERWHEDSSVRDHHLAPLLAIIQSSGTGKSRLMNCVRKQYRKNTSRTILLADKELKDDEKKKIEEDFDGVYVVDTKEDDNKKQRSKFDKFVRDQCKRALDAASKQSDGSKRPQYVRLFFDEAQHLACNEGFLIRVLRWITREINFKVGDKPCKLTVVLAGTSSALANFFREEEQKTNESRTTPLESQLHYEKGKVPFPPFFMLRTMGCLALSWNGSENGAAMPKNGSEYESMIRYSRPLFAKLHKGGIFDEKSEYEVVKKVVLAKPLWKNDKKSCLSVLGTRIQMGPTSTPIISELVAKGYAHLTYYEHGLDGVPNRASFAFLPDPVCARIAMCLMHDGFTFKDTGDGAKQQPILGAKKKEMAAMMGRIFSEGVCLPAKGDYGEIATALYILFCGDILRRKKCADYKEFSVSFSQWMSLVQNRGFENQDGGYQDGGYQDGGYQDGDNILVNCIQFYRQDLRLKLGDMANQTFLKGLYEKACAIYCANNFEAIDLIVPCYSAKDKSHLPAAFSVKNYGYMSPEKAMSFLKESWTKMNQAGIERGLCALVIVGQDRPRGNVTAKDYKDQAIKILNQKANEDQAFVQALKKSPSEMIGSLVACFVCIHDDNFGIDSAVKSGSTLKDHQESEVFINHSDLIQGSLSDIGITAESDLSGFTSRYRNSAEKLFTETVKLKPGELEGN